MSNKTITVGSNAFFKNSIPDFHSDDMDKVILIDNPLDFKISRQIRLLKPVKQCIFEIKRFPKEILIENVLKTKCPMDVGKFLVPEFIKEIDMTIEDLLKLKPVIKNIDDRHSYEKLIFNYYIENNDFYLTDEQLKEVYNEYKIKRQYK